MESKKTSLKSISTPPTACGEETADKMPKRKLDKLILDNFSKLTNAHENVRVKSAMNILRYLSEKYENEKNNEEIKYAVKRLVRGLGSSTAAARAGFFTTLVGLLNLNAGVEINDLLDLIKTELHKSGRNNSGENADICTGQILCCGSIIKAKLWEKCDENNKKQLLEILVNNAKERVYLGLVAYSFIVELIIQISEQEFEKTVLPSLSPEILKPWANQSLDSLFLLVKLKGRYPEIFDKKFFKKNFQVNSLICAENLEEICNILMTIPRVTAIQHPVYDIIINELTAKLLPNLFDGLDKHLRTPNRNRLLLFLKIITNTLNRIQSEKDPKYLKQIATVVTSNFVTQLLGYFRQLNKQQKDKDYENAVQKFFQTLSTTLSLDGIDSSNKVAILKKFLFNPGTFIFEKVTKSKIIQQITANLDVNGVKNLADIYRSVIDGNQKIDSENDSEKWVNRDKLYSVHLLIKLFNLNSMRNEFQWKIDQLTFIMDLALIKADSDSEGIGKELADSIKSAFFGALDLKLTKLEELHVIFAHLIKHIENEINEENIGMKLRTPMAVKDYTVFTKTIKYMNKLGHIKERGVLKCVFLTLFMHMALQLFNDTQMATDSLTELFNCYKRVERDLKTNSKKLNETTSDGKAEPDQDYYWSEVVIDLFLNLLSHNSHVLRNIIKYVFPYLCQYVTATSMNHIVSVIDPQNENPLSQYNEESSSDSDENDSDDQSEENDNDDDDDDDLDIDIDENETVSDKLKLAIHQALSNGGENMLPDDQESIDLDEMSDGEAERLDAALSEAFKLCKPKVVAKKKKQTKDQETLTHFRVRVLDLVEIYLDGTPSISISLEILLLPLIRGLEFAIRVEHQEPLKNRLKNVLKKLFALKKFADCQSVDADMLIELLENLLSQGHENTLAIQEMGEQIADSCVFIVKCAEILYNDDEAITKPLKKPLKNRLLDMLGNELQQFLTKRDSLTPYVLFKNLLQLSFMGNVDLARALLNFLFNDEIRQFKKNQIIELLIIFYSNQRLFTACANAKKIQKKLEESHGKFSENVINFLKYLCDNPNTKNIKEKFICLFFNLLKSIKCSAWKSAQDSISWTDIGQLIREYRSYKTFSTDAKLSFNKLCRVLNVSHIVPMKENTTNLAKVVDEESSSKPEVNNSHEKMLNKKRPNRAVLKLKKHSKKARLEDSNGESLIGGFKYLKDDCEDIDSGLDLE